MKLCYRIVFTTALSVLTVLALTAQAAAPLDSSLPESATAVDSQTTVVDNYELAAKAFAEKQPNAAFIYLKNALQQNPRHLPSKLLLSKVYFDAGNIPATEEELSESLQLGADINLVLPLLGQTLIMQRKVDTLLALEKYSNDFTIQSQFEWALLKGQAYLIRKDETLAQMQFEKALTILPNDVRGLNTLATLYMRLGWFDKSDMLIKRSMDTEPKNEKTWVIKGELALATGNAEMALLDFNQAFTIDSYDPRILRNLATTHLKLQNYDKVQTYIDLILEQSPSDPSATLINAWLLMSDNQEAMAKQSLADLSAKLSLLDESKIAEDLSLLFIQGASEYIQGNYEKARQHLETYLAKAPSDIGAIRMLSEIYIKSNLPRKAAELLEDKKNVIADDINLSARLVQLYIDDNKMIQADQIISAMKIKLPSEPYLAYLEAQVEKSRRRPQQALDILKQYNLGKNEPAPYTLLRGELQLQLNDIAAAKITAEQVVLSKAESNDALNFIAAVHIKDNKPELALPYIEKVLAKDKNNISARFNKAIILKSQGNLADAKTLLNGILTQQKQHTPSLLLLARIELQAANFENAIGRVNQVLVYDSNNTAALETKLAIYKQQQNWSEALSTAQQLNQIDRLKADYLVENTSILIRMERYSDAERYLKILYGLWSHDPENLRYLAQLQTSARNIPAAISTLEKAEALSDKSISIKLELAQLYFNNGNMQAAEKLLDESEKKFGQSATIFLLRGDIAQKQNQLEVAKQLYARAHLLEPENSPAIINLYQLTLKGVGEDEFAQLLETMIKKPATPAWVRKLLADSYLNRGMLPEAQKHYETLLNMPELAGEPSILNNLANIYAKKDLKKAQITAQKGLDNDRKNPALLDTLGWILARQGQYNEALPYLREAYSMNASNHEVRYHIGYTLLKLDRKTEAISELKAAIAGNNQFAEYEEAKALLESL